MVTLIRIVDDDIFLFLDAPILKLRDISVTLPTYRPEIIIPTAFATKN